MTNLFGEEINELIINKPQDSTYTQKVKTPLYTPRDREVHINECYNNIKYQRLVQEIDRSNVGGGRKDIP